MSAKSEENSGDNSEADVNTYAKYQTTADSSTVRNCQRKVQKNL